jgi:hypothetical protein
VWCYPNPQALGRKLSSRNVISARQACSAWRDGLADALQELLLDSQNLTVERLAAFVRITEQVFPKAHSLTLDVGCNTSLTEEQAAQHEAVLVGGAPAAARLQQQGSSGGSGRGSSRQRAAGRRHMECLQHKHRVSTGQIAWSQPTSVLAPPSPCSESSWPCWRAASRSRT